MTSARLLFVYGTLRPGAHCGLGHMARDRLMREAAHVGTATMRGRLLDLGRYPVLVPSAVGAVAGDLLHLASPTQTWSWLDAYEGDGYKRVMRTVRLANGSASRAWCYVGRMAPAGAGVVRGGDWLRR